MKASVNSLFIYPLKSGARLPVEDIPLTERGLMMDRMFMLVHGGQSDEGVYKFVSQRDKYAGKLGQMLATPYSEQRVMFRPLRDGHAFMFDNMSASFNRAVNVSVWKSQFPAQDMGDKAAAYFTEKMGFPCRLVAFDENVQRACDPQFADDGDHTGFADGFPLLVTNTASLEALNAHIAPQDKVDMNRFRPNIVLDGLAPFEEDMIKRLRIGEVEIELVKPCTRCVLTTIDQDTGDKPSKEPMQTLAQMRRGMDKASDLKGVFFGQNAVPRKLGRIRAGDTAEILERKPLHPALQTAKLR